MQCNYASFIPVKVKACMLVGGWREKESGRVGEREQRSRKRYLCGAGGWGG